MHRVAKLMEAIEAGALRVGMPHVEQPKLQRKARAMRRICELLAEELPAGTFDPWEWMPREHIIALLSLAMLGMRGRIDDCSVIEEEAQFTNANVCLLERLTGDRW